MAQENKDERTSPKRPQEQRQASRNVNIVRIAGKDINASFKISRALDDIKGLGYNISNALAKIISEKLGIDINSPIGNLTEEQLESVENIIKDPVAAGLPGYMVNRRRSPEAGVDAHFVGTDLIVRTRQDIEQQIKIMSWRGYRHQFGQKVRGQRTRSTGRTGPTVGVTKKKAEEELKKGAQAEKGAGAQQASSGSTASK